MPNIPLPEEFRVERGRSLVRLIKGDLADRRTYISRRAWARSLYYNTKRPVGGPWRDSSNIHLPVIYEKVEGTVPKIVNAFWGIDPIVHLEQIGPNTDVGSAEITEEYFNWTLDSDIPHLFSTVYG